MPVFISYSHQDRKFVDSLAEQLVYHHVNVWIDRWELAIGDSIIEKIQYAIDGSSALLVILSKSSTNSEWCKKEITGGLLRELEEKRVFAMPVLLEECKIPLFLRGKLYADFRTSFDDGLRVVLEGLAKVSNPALCRFEEPDFHTDYAEDWMQDFDIFLLRLTYAQHSIDQPYTCLTIIEIHFEGDPETLSLKYSRPPKGAIGRFQIVNDLLLYLKKEGDIRPRLSDQFEQVYSFAFQGKTGDNYRVKISSRRLGEDTGKDIIASIHSVVEVTYNSMREILKGSIPDSDQ